MYRAVSDYNGSDTEKCIDLRLDDKLTSVHAVDSNWYIGHNERSEQTGVFPASCVELVTSDGPTTPKGTYS